MKSRFAIFLAFGSSKLVGLYRNHARKIRSETNHSSALRGREIGLLVGRLPPESSQQHHWKLDRMPETVCSTNLNCPASVLRDYLGKTSNLKHITDPEMHLRIVNTADVIVCDGEIEFQVSTYGIKQTMKHRYTEVTPTLIQSEQLEGPTRSWIHKVIIESTGDTTCKLTDHIEFEPPGGMMGFVMTEDKIRESVLEGMEFRYEALAEILNN